MRFLGSWNHHAVASSGALSYIFSSFFSRHPAWRHTVLQLILQHLQQQQLGTFSGVEEGLLQSCFDTLRLFLKHNSSVFLSLPPSSRSSVYAAVTVIAKGSWALPSAIEEGADETDARRASPATKHFASEGGNAPSSPVVSRRENASGSDSAVPRTGGSLALRVAALRLLQTHVAVFLPNILQDVVLTEKRRLREGSTCESKDGAKTYDKFVSSFTALLSLPAPPPGSGPVMPNFEEEGRVGSILDCLLLVAVSPGNLRLAGAGLGALTAVVQSLLAFCFDASFQGRGRGGHSSLSRPQYAGRQRNEHLPVERSLSSRELRLVPFEEVTEERRTKMLDTGCLDACLQRLQRLLRQLYWGLLRSGQELLVPSAREELTVRSLFLPPRSGQEAGISDEEQLVVFRRCGVFGKLLVLLLGPSAARSGLSALLCEKDGEVPRVIGLRASEQLLWLADALLSEERVRELKEGADHLADGGGARVANAGLFAKCGPLVVHPAAALIRGALSVSSLPTREALSGIRTKVKREGSREAKVSSGTSVPRDFERRRKRSSVETPAKDAGMSRLVEPTVAAAWPLLRRLAAVTSRLVDWFVDTSSFYSYTSSSFKKPQIAAAFGAACVALISAREAEEMNAGAVGRDVRTQTVEETGQHPAEEGSRGVMDDEGQEDLEENAASVGGAGELLDLLIQQSLLVALQGEKRTGGISEGDRRTADAEPGQEERWEDGEEGGGKSNVDVSSHRDLFVLEGEEQDEARSKAVGELWRLALLAVGHEDLRGRENLVRQEVAEEHIPLSTAGEANTWTRPARDAELKEGQQRKGAQAGEEEDTSQQRAEDLDEREQTAGEEEREKEARQRGRPGEYGEGKFHVSSSVQSSALSFYQRQLGDSLLRCCLGLYRLGVSAHFLLHQQQLVLLQNLRRAVASAASGELEGGGNGESGRSAFPVSAADRLPSSLLAAELTRDSAGEESAPSEALQGRRWSGYSPGSAFSLAESLGNSREAQTSPRARARGCDANSAQGAEGSRRQTSSLVIAEERRAEGSSWLSEGRGARRGNSASFDLGKAAEGVYQAAVLDQQTSANAVLLLSLGFFLESAFLAGGGRSLLALLLPW